jgi:tape measure domain-containing protein
MAGLKFDITGDNGNMLSALHGVQKGVRQTQQVVEQSGQGIEQMFAGIKSAAVSALGAFSAQQFASKVMNVRGQFQQLEVAFGTMLGSAEKANSLMGQLVKTAAVTPFDLQGVANGAKQLLAYGIQADDVNDTLVRLGDIAAGLSMPLNDLVYLYGTTMVQGRMFTMDLRQFQGRGIPIADELAKQFGVAKEKVGELVTAGKVGSEEMKKAIISMTSEGGKFAGLMEKQSHTITGQISNIEDAVDTMFNAIGQKSEGVINTGLSSVSYLVENWEKIGKVVLEVAVAYGSYKAALLAVYVAHKVQAIYGAVTAFLSLAKGVHTAKDAMLLFNLVSKANPIGLIVSVITSAAAAFYLFGKNTDAAAKAQESLNKIVEKAAEKAAEEKTNIDLLVAAAKNDKLSMDERKEAINKLNNLIPNYNAQLDETTGKYKASEQALKNYLVQLQRKYELEGAKEQIKEIGKKKAEVRIKYQRGQAQADKLHPFSKDKEINGGTFRSLAYGTSMSAGMAINKRVETNKDKRLQFKRRVTEEYKTSIKELDTELKAIDEAYGEDLQRSAVKQSEQVEKGAVSGTGKGGKGGHGKDNTAEEIAKRQQEIEAYKKEIERQNKEVELELRQQNLDLDEESYEKEVEQINLNYDRLIAENDKRRKDMIEALKDNKVNKWLNKNPKATKVQQDNYRNSLNLTDSNLTATQNAQLAEYDAIAEKQKSKAQKDLYTKLLGEFQDYEARRTQINADFDKKRKDLEAMPANTKGREQAIEELEKKRKESIKSVNDEEISKMRESSTLLIDLFGDAADKSDKEIRKIITETGDFLSYLKNTKTSDITANFGFSTEQLKALKASPEQIKAITEQLERLKQAAKSSNPFKQLAEDLKNLFTKNKDGKGESTEAKLKKLGASAAETAEMIGGIASKLSDMFDAAGNTGMADAMGTLSDAMTSVSNIGKGFAQGGIVGGITAAAGEAIGFVTKAFQASARHAEALKKIQQDILSQQRVYNLSLLEEKLNFEQSATVFGNLDYTKATNAVDVLREAYSKLNAELKGSFSQQRKFKKGVIFFGKKLFDYSDVQKSYSGLADVQIKTGHKKTGLFGWGKGRDLYSSILDVYPQLIDSAGNFNKKLAESIIGSREFNGQGKEALQNMIDLYDKTEEAAKQLKDYLSGIFGDLGNNMTDALVDAFKNGTDAGKAFGDSISKMLENIGKQMIFQTLFSGIIEDANNKMLNVMKNQSMSADSKFKNYVDILDTMTSQILGQQGTFNDLMSRYKGMAADKGINLFGSENEQQSASANGASSITYEQSTNLIALITAGNISRDQIKDIFSTIMASAGTLTAFSSSTNSAVLEIKNLMIYSNSHLEDILKYTKSIYSEFSDKIDSVNKNLMEIR